MRGGDGELRSRRERLSALDAAFLSLERADAPRHVGWAARFAPVPLYLMGCEVTSAYPVVPLTGGHGMSIGMTTIQDEACFGVYAQVQLGADAEHVARRLGEEVDALLARAQAAPERSRPAQAAA